MKVLFIGGTGVISSGCVSAAVEDGFDLTLLNRGRSTRPIPDGVEVLQADYRNKEVVRRLLAGRQFDVVVNWIVFTPEQAAQDILEFREKTSQYIFISSASVYQKPPVSLPITESTPLSNPFWKYSRDKIACEQLLMESYSRDRFPVTIVRPSHTYDRTLFPLRGGCTLLKRMISGKPIILHGDGTSLWVLTHSHDFAKGFTGLLSNSLAIGEAFHITSDELLSWNQIADQLAKAAGVEARIVHITSEEINRYDQDWGESLLGDKSHSVIFDNDKIRRMVPGFKAQIPFQQGAREIVEWYSEDVSRQQVDHKLDSLIDRIVADLQVR